MDVELKPARSQDEILIRPFTPEDSLQVLEVYFAGLVDGVGSAGHFAVTQAFLHWRPMYLAYILLVAGGGINLYLPQSYPRIFGAMLVAASLVFMASIYYRIRSTFLGYYQDGLRSDMNEITRYYRLDHEKNQHPIRSFWVAEVPSVTPESRGKVVGCVALDCSSTSDGAQLAELRRLFVLPAYRKRRIGTKLIQTLISYAKRHGISALQLETTNFQPIAREMYTRLGWHHHSTRDSDFEAGGMRMNFVEYRLLL